MSLYCKIDASAPLGHIRRMHWMGYIHEEFDDAHFFPEVVLRDRIAVYCVPWPENVEGVTKLDVEATLERFVVAISVELNLTRPRVAQYCCAQQPHHQEHDAEAQFKWQHLFEGCWVRCQHRDQAVGTSSQRSSVLYFLGRCSVPFPSFHGYMYIENALLNTLIGRIPAKTV